jgi:predicted metal-dependent phosphoesterase TrpH
VEKWKADLHLHTTASDGSDSSDSLLRKVKEKGIAYCAITDHDTLAGVHAVKEIPSGVTLIAGIEFSTITKYREAHILGYGFDATHPVMKKVIDKGRLKRKRKLENRLVYLSHLGYEFSQEDKEKLRQLNACAKPHLARMLMQYEYVSSMEEGIKIVAGCHDDDDRLDYHEVIKAIHDANGWAVWAHPLGGEHKRHLAPWECERQLCLLLDAGIDGLECFYSRYNQEEEDYLCSLANRFQLTISGGSDYHGINKSVELGRLNTEGRQIDASQLTILHKIVK